MAEATTAAASQASEPCKHEWMKLRREWQTSDFFNGILHHSEETIVCKLCYAVVNPWKKEQA